MRDPVATTWPGFGAWIKRGWLLVLLAVILAGGVFTAVARADGDPASDYLVANHVFLSYGSSAVSSTQRQLLSVVAAANRAGLTIRVAIVSSEYDLGSVTALWRRPRLYARFLGLELSSVYKQRLLVVMPNGLGFSWLAHQTGSADRLLLGIPVGRGGGGLPGAAQAAVRRLAAAAGVTLTLTPPRRARTSGTVAGGQSDGGFVIIAAVVAALALGVLVVIRRRRRRGPKVASEPFVAGRRTSALPVRWAVPGLAALCGVAVAVPIVALISSRHVSAASGVSAGSVVTPPPVSWPADRRPAPGFVLRDQTGRRVSVAAYRGRPVILTFVDPLCRNLCPLEAHVLNSVVGQMPPAQRPEILAVSVDIYANARRNLLQDVRKWGLVPQWRWAVGGPAQLAQVWKQYKIGVSVKTTKIAGTTINYVLHTEAAYIIDASGHERALFLWPFYPQDVERTLRQLT